MRGGVREWLGFFRWEVWVKPTEVAGVAEEAHRRWPKGRSEQGARKAKVDPPRIHALPRGSCRRSAHPRIRPLKKREKSASSLQRRLRAWNDVHRAA